MNNFDCIITGAGTAGCILAKKLAEAGFRVLILDKKSRKNIGHSWEVSIERSVFARVGLKLPDKKFWIENPVKSRFYSDKKEDYIEIDSVHDNVFNIYHKTLNQFLLKEAVKAGAEFRGGYRASDLISSSDDIITGIKGTRKSLFGKKSFSLNTRITVCASGIDAVLRKKTPESFMIKHKLRMQDFAYAWMALHEMTDKHIEKLQETLDIVPGMSYSRLGKFHGYQTMHLRKDGTICFIFSSAVTESKEHAAEILYREFVKKNPVFGRIIYRGGRPIPIRRAIDTMAGDGFLCIGDSACQVIPTMGSGVASSMHASDIASHTITDAFNCNNFSKEKLWSYNHKYQVKRGAILASYDIIRRFLQSLNTKDIDSIFKSGLLKNDNFVNTFSSNKIHYDVLQVMDNLVKIFSNFSLVPIALRLMQSFNDSGKALKLYKKYPEKYNKEKFIEWQKQTDSLFSHYRTFSKGEKESFL
jgi:digeranylgeranylglycerophospholipid reductase